MERYIYDQLENLSNYLYEMIIRKSLLYVYVRIYAFIS